MIKANIYTYDVWGNAEEGYEVNDIYFDSRIDLEESDLFDDENLYWALIRLDMLAPDSKVYFEWQDEDLCYVNGSTDGKPLGEIRFNIRVDLKETDLSDDGEPTLRSEEDLPKDFEGYFYFEGDDILYYTFLDDVAGNGRVIRPADSW